MSISLVSISNINHKLVEFSINKSCDTKFYDEVLVFSDKPLIGLKHKHKYLNIDKTIRPFDPTTGRPAPFNYDVYNDFLFKHLGDHIKTEHVINIHYDGFGVNADEWTDEFLEYDYIGSPTHKKWYPLANSLRAHDLYDGLPNEWYTGGGGFSLRSKKLLDALRDPALNCFLSDKNYQRCEDWCISSKHKEYLINEHKIKFAPLEIAMKFSTELLTGLNFSFGFHGWDNIPLFMSEEETMFFISNLKRDSLLRGSLMTRRFVANCHVYGYDRAIGLLNHIMNEKEKSKKVEYSR